MTEQKIRETIVRMGVKYFDKFATAVRLSDDEPHEAREADKCAARLDTIYIMVYTALELGSEDEAVEAIRAAYEAKKAREGTDG